MLITSLQITKKISDITIYDFLNGLIRYCEKEKTKPIAVVPLIESRQGGRGTEPAEGCGGSDPASASLWLPGDQKAAGLHRISGNHGE